MIIEREQEMFVAAEDLRFELAARLRDEIADLRREQLERTEAGEGPAPGPGVAGAVRPRRTGPPRCRASRRDGPRGRAGGDRPARRGDRLPVARGPRPRGGRPLHRAARAPGARPLLGRRLARPRRAPTGPGTRRPSAAAVTRSCWRSGGSRAPTAPEGRLVRPGPLDRGAVAGRRSRDPGGRPGRRHVGPCSDASARPSRGRPARPDDCAAGSAARSRSPHRRPRGSLHADRWSPSAVAGSLGRTRIGRADLALGLRASTAAASAPRPATEDRAGRAVEIACPPRPRPVVDGPRPGDVRSAACACARSGARDRAACPGGRPRPGRTSSGG